MKTLLLILSALLIVNFANATTGLTARYYEGNWNQVPDFFSMVPVKKGIVKDVDLNYRNRETGYAILWKGFITIPASGTYTFETISDDGSRLYIGEYIKNTVPLISNDGVHAPQVRTGTMTLKAGVYAIAVSYLQAAGGQMMEIYWSSNTGIVRTKLPASLLRTDSTDVAAPPAVTPSGATGGLTGINNYYFSSSTGDDNRSAAEAQNTATPWKTLAKVNAVMSSFKAGDAVLLKRGDTFDGSISIGASGTASLPVIVSAYGSGNKPVVSGFAGMNNWLARGNGVYECAVPAAGQVNMVTLNGQVQAMGRWPNSTTANGGYLTVDAHSGNTSFTDADLNTGANWTGAEVVIRKVDWVLDRCLITSQRAGTITYNSPTMFEAGNGRGYFIQNSPYTLDQLGEWYYDAAAKKLLMYFGAAAPASFSVMASCVPTLITVNGKSNVTIDNITMQGGSVQGVRVENQSQNVRIQNCQIAYSGIDGLTAQDAPYLVVEGNTINSSNNSGIRLTFSSNALIKNNTITSSGVIPGMGQSNNQQMDGIFADCGPNNVIESNKVYRSGYCGITFTGDYTQVRNNLVDSFCMTVTDGGGIYTWGGWDKVGRVVSGNTVLNGIGAWQGSSTTENDGAAGIYLDDISSHVDILNNTVAHCSRTGIYLHNNQVVNVKGNTLFDNKAGFNTVFDVLGLNVSGTGVDFSIRSLSFTSNVVVAATSTQRLLAHESLAFDFGQQGVYDSNYYAKPLDQAKTGLITCGSKGDMLYQDLKGWQAQYPSYDKHSVVSPVTIPAYTNLKAVGANMFANSTFDQNVNGTDNYFMKWDGGGHLDQGAVKVSTDGSTGTLYAHLFFQGQVVAGRKYLIRMSLLGSSATQNVRVMMQRNGPDWNMISPDQYFPLSTTRTENEFLFIPTTTESNYMLTLSINAAYMPYYIDNVSMQEVTCDMAAGREEQVRFEYNAENNSRTVTLDQAYLDVKGNTYQGQIALAAHSSLVLLPKAQAVVTPAAAVAAKVTTPAATEQAVAVAARGMKVSTDQAFSKLFVRTGDAHATGVTIFNAAGNLVKTIAANGSNQLSADISTWASGVYIVNTTINGHSESQRFVKL